MATHPFSTPTGVGPKFINTEKLMTDTKTLSSLLPEDVNLVIGIARSGLPAATMVSMLLHLPLLIFRQSEKDLISAGHGWRLQGAREFDGKPVVIDDTVMSGRSLKETMPAVWKQFPKAISATVYCNPLSRHKPNYFVEEWYYPQIAEWNLPNSIYSPHNALDFDGILCEDCPRDSDDDGEKYVRFLETARPKYITRRGYIPLIVTGRLEKYRPQTEAWLRKWNVAYHQLEMWPGTFLGRTVRKVAEFKAKHFKAFLEKVHEVKPPMFVESDPSQAQLISQLTDGITVCPAIQKCFQSGK